MFSINTDGSGYTRLHSFESSVGAAPNSALLMLNGGDLVGTLGSSGDCGYGALYRYSASGTTYDGETSCGIRRRADDGGGHGGPAVLLLLGALGLWRRRVG
jgi:MYXO-CTERM domain-containing protein